MSRYAITCTLDLVHSRRRSQTWELVLQAARDNVVYVEAFTAQLVSPNTMSDELRVVKEAQDSLRSYEELRALREVAVQRLERDRGQADEPEPEGPEEPQAPTLQRWFPLWGGWYGSGEVEVEAEEERAPPRIEEYLQDALKEDQEVLGVAHKDVVFSHLTVHLTRASVRLVRAQGEGGQGQLLFDIQFDDVKVSDWPVPSTRTPRRHTSPDPGPAPCWPP
jgi:vacuolar protein sorting-associated protein 13D